MNDQRIAAWRGKPIDELTREELIEALNMVGSQLREYQMPEAARERALGGDMTVTAIKCENCDGSGLAWNRLPENCWSDLGVCPLCNGTGYERPPQQHAAIPNERKSDE